MVTQKRISDYTQKPVSKVGSNGSSSAIVIIDLSDEIDDEIIKVCESFGTEHFLLPTISELTW